MVLKKRIILLAAMAFLSIPSLSASAQVINEDQELHFGRWVVTNDSSPRTITLQANGTYSNSPELFMLEPPMVGVYEISGLTPGATVSSIVVTQIGRLNAGNSKDFALDNFDVVTPPVVNPSGVLHMTLGARATTSGTGGSYPDATYTGLLNVIVNF